MSQEDEANLWHPKLGNLHLKGMNKILLIEAVRGIPKLKIDEEKNYGECKIRKQTRMSNWEANQKIQHLTTSRVLKLLHMDLMGPIQVGIL